ncbi:MAG: glutamate-1-semialdehyde 2,1-aminomutase [Euryarchaeota archaeon]|nr:glutamate-1-semialdehyde 2,1-aminomutase [Euryarchaeota archaeon]
MASRSQSLYRRARRRMPGGVSSPARAFSPHPVYMARGRGSHLWDVDGRRYTDYCLAFGALLLGHSHPRVVEAVGEQMARGSLYGTPVEDEVRLAEEVHRWVPSLERLRLVTTGTEATMSAVRLARGATGREVIVKMDGGFHGSHGSVLVRAGSGAATHGVPGSLGVPRGLAGLTEVVPYNDADALRGALRRRRGRVAAVILEPVLGNIGPVLPREGYLQEVREATEDHGVLLNFVEVITGFRVHPGGAQGLYHVKPDLTTLGKVLGGGLPLALYGGRADLLSHVSPEGGVYQAGTYSGNPLSLAAALATLRVLRRGRPWPRLASLTRRLARGLQEAAGPGTSVVHLGSMFQVFFRPRAPRDYTEVKECDSTRYMEFLRGCIRRGVYLSPSQYETQFLSTAHTPRDIETTLHRMREVLGAKG